LVFGVRDDIAGTWWEWDMVVSQAAELALPTVPVVFRGVVESEKKLEELTRDLCAEPSVFGGVREGVVVRRRAAFDDATFSRYLAKWVRKDHVTTDEHWMHQNVKPQRLRSKASAAS
jgi:RNA ligase